jgi:ferredoxin-NADP reductase
VLVLELDDLFEAALLHVLRHVVLILAGGVGLGPLASMRTTCRRT